MDTVSLFDVEFNPLSQKCHTFVAELPKKIDVLEFVLNNIQKNDPNRKHVPAIVEAILSKHEYPISSDILIEWTAIKNYAKLKTTASSLLTLQTDYVLSDGKDGAECLRFKISALRRICTSNKIKPSKHILYIFAQITKLIQQYSLDTLNDQRQMIEYYETKYRKLQFKYDNICKVLWFIDDVDEDTTQHGPGLVYILTSSLFDAVIIGKTHNNFEKLRSKFTELYGENITIHIRPTIDTGSIEDAMHESLKGYKLEGKLFKKEFITVYIDMLNTLTEVR